MSDPAQNRILSTEPNIFNNFVTNATQVGHRLRNAYEKDEHDIRTQSKALADMIMLSCASLLNAIGAAIAHCEYVLEESDAETFDKRLSLVTPCYLGVALVHARKVLTAANTSTRFTATRAALDSVNELLEIYTNTFRVRLSDLVPGDSIDNGETPSQPIQVENTQVDSGQTMGIEEQGCNEDDFEDEEECWQDVYYQWFDGEGEDNIDDGEGGEEEEQYQNEEEYACGILD